MRHSFQGFATLRGLVCGGLFVLAGFASSPSLAQGFLVMQATCGGSLLTEGESQRKGLEDYVEISSFHNGLSTETSLDNTEGGGGKVSQGTTRVVKPVSRSSIGLVESLITGLQCQEIRVERWGLDANSGESVKKWEVVLINALVNERKEWHAGSDGAPEESLGFVAMQIHWTHFGGKDGPVSFAYDFANLTPL